MKPRSEKTASEYLEARTLRRYAKAHLARVCRVRAGNELRLPSKKSGGFHEDGFNEEDWKRMTVRSGKPYGWELPTPFRDFANEEE